MSKPKITLYVDIVSPFAYIAFYALEVSFDHEVRALHLVGCAFWSGC